MLRLVPLWFFSIVLVAAALGVLWDSGGRGARRLALALGALMLGMGVNDSFAVIQTGRPTQLADNWSVLTRHKGYRYMEYLARVMKHFEGSAVDKLNLVEAFDEPNPELVRAAAARAVFDSRFLENNNGLPGEVLARAHEVLVQAAGGDKQRLADYEQGLGLLLVKSWNWNRIKAFRWVGGLPPGPRDTAWAALGRFGWGPFPVRSCLEEALENTASEARATAFFRGLGHWAYLWHMLNPTEFMEMTKGLPEPAAALIREGFEAERLANMWP